MEWLIFPSLAFAPGVFWLWFFARKDRYRPEPKKLIALTFVLGMVSTVPVGILSFAYNAGSIFDPNTQLSAMLLRTIVIAAVVEELAKFLVVRLGAYRTLHFDEPSDGLVYAASASLGFASLENLLYVWQFGPEVMIFRAPLSTVGHVLWSSLWGYPLGRSKFMGYSGFFLVIAGIIAASLAHAFFNLSLVASQVAPIAVVVALGSVPLGIWWILRRFDWANSVSPFRFRRNYPRINCIACGNSISVISQYCRFCGHEIADTDYELVCSQCRTVNRSDADYCTQCGDKFVFGDA